MKKSPTAQTRAATTPTEASKKKLQAGVPTQSWQSTFSKRLPHRPGQPLSSSSGGDGSAIEQ